MTNWFVRLTSIVMALMLCGMGVLFYFAFVQDISPLERQRFISIEATTSNGHGTFIITREFCSRTPAEGSVIRIFRRLPDKHGAMEEVFELPPLPIHLLPGCHMRPRVVEVPDTITPGHYLYVSGIRWCAALRCKMDWFPAVKIDVDTFQGRHQLKIETIKYEQPEIPGD